MSVRTVVVFPNSVGAISGVSYVEIGMRHDGHKGVRLLRSAFKDSELQDENGLAWRAAELMAQSLRLPAINATAPRG